MREEAERIINIYNSSQNNLDFTIYISSLESKNPPLFKEILKLLATGKYAVKYLNSTGA